MRVIKNMIQDKKDLAEAYKMLEESAETMNALLDAFAAERAQKERYRIAFLDRMNVPVIGTAWDGES